MPYSQLISSFNAGELSPFLDAQVGVEKYAAGCRTLENFIPLPYGGVMRRPGTEYLGRSKFPDKLCVLRPFVFSETTNFVIEFGDLYARFWNASGSPVLAENATEWTAFLPSEEEPTTPRSYSAGEFVTHEDVTYFCSVAHTTAGDFDDDLDAGYWVAQEQVEVETPYTQSELREVQFVQVNDIVYFVHQNHPPQRLIRRALEAGTLGERFVWAETAWDWPALLEENTGPNTLEASATTGTVTLTVGYNDFAQPYPIFTSQHVGSYWQIAHTRSTSSISKTFAATGDSGTIQALGGWSLSTYGTWGGTLVVQRSYDGGSSWSDIRSYSASSDRNIADSGTEDRECLLRLSFTRTAGTASDYAILTLSDPVSYGLVRITGIGGTNGRIGEITLTNAGRGYSTVPTVSITGGGGSGAAATCMVQTVKETFRSGSFTNTYTTYRIVGIAITNRGTGYTSNPAITINGSFALGYPYPSTATAVGVTAFEEATVTAEVINDLYSTAPTAFWTEGAWNGAQGYPRAISAHDGRIIYGGTSKRPQSVWGSRIDDFQNFRLGVLADDAIFFTIASRTTNLIQWMASVGGVLQVGKLDGEGQLSSGSSSEAISASAVLWQDTTGIGSTHAPAIILNDSVLFLQRRARKVRELSFSNDRQAYVAPDQTLLAEHITQSGVVEWAAQTVQESILWAIRNDGQLIGLTFEGEQGIFAWHRHTTAGQFESVCVIPGEFGDDVWLAVRREIDGETVRYIERFKVDWRETFEAEDKENWWYVDCGKRIENETPSTTLAGLEHLEGATVAMLADGASAGSAEVSGGEATLAAATSIAIVGLPYVSTLRPMKLHAQLASGSSRNGRSQVTSIGIQVAKSLGCEFRTREGAEWDRVIFRNENAEMDASPPPFTGVKNVLCGGGFSDEGADVWIRQSEPMPLTVVALIPDWMPTGKSL